MARVLISDADAALRAALAASLRIAGWDVVEAGDLAEAGERIAREEIDILLADIEAPGESVRLEEVLGGALGPRIIAMGAVDSVRGVRALRSGAFDFVRKPFAIGTVERALYRARADHAPLARPPLMTCSETMKRVLGRAERAAASDTTVWIRGETGTGKSALARWIHAHSERRTGPFATVACASLNGEGGAAELFGGHDPGVIAAATGGTLCLERVDELDRGLQARLLRAWPDGARLVATARRDLRSEAQAGRFLVELCHRLDVIRLSLPPLRERGEDVALLARALLDEFAERQQRPVPRLTPTAVAALREHELPGNVRQLANLMQRAVLLFAGRDVDVPRLLSPRLETGREEPAAFEVESLNLKEIERRAIARSLAESGGNRTRASRVLGISVRTLRNKIRQYQIES